MSILNHAKLNIRSIIRRLLPAQPCVLCGSMSDDGLWCKACDESLPYLRSDHCPVCALPTPSGQICGHCLNEPPLYTRTRAVFRYAFPLDKLIQGMKYGDQLPLAHELAKRLALRVGNDIPPDCVIPMPLHPAKLRERGYNQSMLLAAAISRQLDVELLSNAAKRTRNTPAQSTLPWKDREKNVRDAFSCNTDLGGKHVALVDDVLTTGASMNALAKTIRKCGAAEISVWVVARTMRRQDTVTR
ncbi:MAG: ComF family protein [Gallionella sp.]